MCSEMLRIRVSELLDFIPTYLCSPVQVALLEFTEQPKGFSYPSPIESQFASLKIPAESPCSNWGAFSLPLKSIVRHLNKWADF